MATGWWAFYRGPDLLTRTDNPRRGIADRSVPRGSILDRRNDPVITTLGLPPNYRRQILHPDLSSVLGYNNPIYGQSGMEASMDTYLRCLQGYPGLALWWNRLLYGQPPPGLDIRLSLDLSLQRTADNLLSHHAGALVLLNAESGEILVMASHPTYDANQLDLNWDELVQDSRAPFLNRATLGRYPIDDLENILFPDLPSTPEWYTSLQIRIPRVTLPLWMTSPGFSAHYKFQWQPPH